MGAQGLDKLVDHVRRMMGPYFDAEVRSEGPATVVAAKWRETMGTTFSVHVTPKGGGLSVGIVRGDDNVIDGLPHEWDRKRPVKDRCFLQYPHDERERQRFTTALKAEVAETRERYERRDVDDAAETLGARLQELIDIDPQAAGDVIAGILKEAMDGVELREVTEAVQQAESRIRVP